MKRSEIIPAVLDALAPLGNPVIYDDFSQSASGAMENALRTGVCLVVKPLLGSKRTAQAGARVTEIVDFSVHVRVNPATAPADLNTYDLQDAIITALCQIQSLKVSDDATTLVIEDIGCLTHALLFHVIVTNL